MIEFINLTIKELIIFHESIISNSGGSSGIRDLGLIKSALERPYSSFDGKDLYDSTEKKISVLVYSLISNHGFVDGNKRIGVATLVLLCKLNNVLIKFTQDELVELGLNVASGKLNDLDIYDWILTRKVNN